MGDDKPLDPKSIRMDLTVPCDERFRKVLTIISERMAEYVGYAKPEAEELATTIVLATDGVLEHAEAPNYSSVEVTFATSEEEIEVRLRYLRENGATDARDRPDIERLLSRRRDNEAPLDLIQRAVKRVEFGREDGVEFCALTKVLPEET